MGARIRVYGTPRDPGHGLFVGRFYLQQDEGFARGDLILRFPGFYDEAWYQQGPMRRDAEANLDQQLQRRSSRFWLLLASAVNGRFTPFRTTGSDWKRYATVVVCDNERDKRPPIYPAPSPTYSCAFGNSQRLSLSAASPLLRLHSDVELLEKRPRRSCQRRRAGPAGLR